MSEIPLFLVSHLKTNRTLNDMAKVQIKSEKTTLFNPNRSLEKASCHFLMTAIRKTALYMLDS